jgi:hypothetical protein
MTAMTAVSAGGQLMQGYGAYSAGKSADRIAQGEAAALRDQAAQEAEKITTAGNRQRGEARTTLAGSGVAVDAGTALTIDEDIARRTAEDARMTLLTGERQARQVRYEGQMARIEGRQALTGSVLQAGSTVVNGWSKKGGASGRSTPTTGDFARADRAMGY